MTDFNEDSLRKLVSQLENTVNEAEKQMASLTTDNMTKEESEKLKKEIEQMNPVVVEAIYKAQEAQKAMKG